KSKRRRPARPTSPVPGGTPAAKPETTGVSPAAAPSVEQILDDVVHSGAGPRATATPTLAPAAAGGAAGPAPARRDAGTGGRAGRAATVRRRYSEYAEEYQYIQADLHRIMIVAAILIAMLFALSFFIE